MTDPVLSILLITHNQRELLQRCLKSVLAQELHVPFEVIISDDRSTDDTKDWVFEQKALWEGKKDNLVEIKYTYCDSDDCNPSTVSERCGWNKLNAYKQACGKYFVNIDADDYLRSSDIYQRQIDLLESHPECSMCMQRVLSLNEGEPFERGKVWPKHPKLREGTVINKEDFIFRELRGLNQGYMIRRHPEDDMQTLYGKWFDDTVITYHHVQYGPVVFLDRADYVWVQYPKSISHDMTEDDMLITYGLLPLHHAKMIPSLQYLFLKQGVKTLIHMMKYAPEFPKLSQQYHRYLSLESGFIYKYYTEKSHDVFGLIRYKAILWMLLFMNKHQLTSKGWLKLAKHAML